MKRKIMLREKLLIVSIALIVMFTIMVYLLTNNRVNNLMNRSVATKVTNISSMGMDILQSRYPGDWIMQDGSLFLGSTLMNDNTEILDEITDRTDCYASIYLADERIATSAVDKLGGRTVELTASKDVIANVLEKGESYEKTEKIFDQKYEVKYIPIKDRFGKTIGMWSVAVPQMRDGQSMQLLRMRFSIVGISALCGIVGCLILMLYAKKFLKGINTLKVSFLGNNTGNNNTHKRILRMSLVLVLTFCIIWFIIQGYTIGNVVSSLERDNINEGLSVSSNLGYMLFDELYDGDWSVQEDGLYKGQNRIDNNTLVLNRVSYGEGYFTSIFKGDTSISVNAVEEEQTNLVGTKAPKEVISTVLNKGKEFMGEAVVSGQKKSIKYIPLKGADDKAVGMWGVGFDQRVSAKQIQELRKRITQISLFSIVVAFIAFVCIAKRMLSDIKNFKVSLHTNMS